MIGSTHLVFGSLFGTSLDHHFNLTPKATHIHQHALQCPILWIVTSYAKMGFYLWKIFTLRQGPTDSQTVWSGTTLLVEIQKGTCHRPTKSINVWKGNKLRQHRIKGNLETIQTQIYGKNLQMHIITRKSRQPSIWIVFTKYKSINS